MEKANKEEMIYNPNNPFEKWLTTEIEPQKTFLGHQNSVECCTFNQQSSNELFSGSHDKTIKKWDISQQKCSGTLLGHSEGVWALQSSKDGKQLLSCSPDTKILIWDLKNNKIQREIKEHDNNIYSARFNEDQTMIASCGQDSKVIIYDIRKEQRLATIQSDARIIYQVCWSKDGKYLLTSDFDGSVTIYDASSFKLLHASPHYTSENRAYQLDADFSSMSKSGQKIYTTYEDCQIRVYEYKNNKLGIFKCFMAHLDVVKCISLAGKSGIFASGSRDGTARLWSASDCKFRTSLSGHNENVAGISLAEEGNKVIVATAGWDQRLNIYTIDC